MDENRKCCTPWTDPQVVLDHLRDLLNDIKRAFDAAIPAAHGFFRSEGELPERTLFAAIVRWYVKRALRSYGVSEEWGERSVDYELDDVSNIGLIISCEGFQIRILKTRDSKVPVSGSTTRQEFYQHNLLYESGERLDFRPSILNLIVLWETDYVSSAALSVACPKREVDGLTEGRRKVECYWQKQITAPVVALPGTAEVERLQVVDSELDEVTLLEETDVEQPREQFQPSLRVAIGGINPSPNSNGEGPE
jgi:hypothetical protein